MRNVSPKPTTLRTARARAEVTAAPETLAAVREDRVPKGDPRPVAKVAAVIAAKKTTEWIPYCHNIPIEGVNVDIQLLEDRIVIDVEVITVAKTGVEMEAITAAAAAAVTIYDMLKMLDEDMEIVRVRLLEKRGGKSDGTRPVGFSAAVLTISDRVSAGSAEDRSGPILAEGLTDLGASTVERATVADDQAAIRAQVEHWIAQGVDFIVTTGGTGIGPRDRTVEAIQPLLELQLQGVAEQFRRYGQDRHRTAMLSRAFAGVSQTSLILALPGSPSACGDALHALFPGLLHARSMLLGEGHP